MALLDFMKTNSKPAPGRPKSSPVVASFTRYTLAAIQADVPYLLRTQYEGNIDSIEDAISKTYLITITLTHTSTGRRHHCHTKLKRNATFGEIEWAGKEAADALGDAIMKVAKPEPKPRIEKLDKNVRLTTKAKKKRAKKARCKICGETDDVYPEWEGECSHTKEERKNG